MLVADADLWGGQMERPLRLLRDSSEDIDKGGLACSIPAQKSKNLRLVDGEADPVECVHLAVLDLVAFG